MAHTFECEVRFKIENITDFEARLNQLGGNISYAYEFIDYYYRPIDGKWNPAEKNLRIRDWINPQHQTTVYFDKLQIISIDGLQFKRSMYSEGKLPLFRNELTICKSLLEDIGFEFWFSIRKEKARLWEIAKHNFCTAIEYIEGIGWIGELEFEGTEPEKAKLDIENALDALNIPKKLVTYKPVSLIYLEHTKADKINFAD